MIVGLTGGIATGKSTVSGMLQATGAHIIDADQVAREVVAPGEPAWQAIRETFGEEVFQADGSLDRPRMGAVVFKDAGLRRKLEQIVHPAVRVRIDALTSHYRQMDPHGLIVQDVPLLMETGAHKRFEEVILVYAPAHVQLERLMRRDGMGESEALARIRAQMPIEDKRRLATRIIDNSGSREATRKQVQAVYATLTAATPTEHQRFQR